MWRERRLTIASTEPPSTRNEPSSSVGVTDRLPVTGSSPLGATFAGATPALDDGGAVGARLAT